MRVKNAANWVTGLQRFKGNYQVWGHPKYGLILAKWPRKRGPKKTPGQQDNNDTFAQVVAWAKNPLASEVEAAQEATKASGYLIRDALESACYGKLMVAYLKDGRVLQGKRVVSQTIQSALDTITSNLGDMLVRGPTGWMALPAGDLGFAIISIGENQVPVYQEQSGGGGGGQPTYSALPTIAPPSVSTSAVATIGTAFVANKDININALWSIVNATGTEAFEISLVTWSVSGTTYSIDTILYQSVCTPPDTTWKQWVRTATGDPIYIADGTQFAILVTLTSASGTTACPIYETTVGSLPMALPGEQQNNFQSAKTSVSPSDVMTVSAISNRPLALGFDWQVAE